MPAVAETAAVDFITNPKEVFGLVAHPKYSANAIIVFSVFCVSVLCSDVCYVRSVPHFLVHSLLLLLQRFAASPVLDRSRHLHWSVLSDSYHLRQMREVIISPLYVCLSTNCIT